MSELKIVLNGQILRLNDLGTEMNRAFVQLYEAFNGNISFDLESFNYTCQAFFDSHQNIPTDASWHDNYFHNFALLWNSFMARGQFEASEHIWSLALEPVQLWEQNHPTARLHKGAAYYYLGVTTTLRRDIDRGFLFIHQALEEDRKTHGSIQASPALAFVTLDDSLGPQIFQPKIQEVCNYLKQLLEVYRNERGKTLTIEQFRTKFLALSNLQESVFVFVYALFRLYTLLKETPSQITQSLFTGQLSVNLLFDICLVIENVIKYTSEAKIKRTKHKTRVTFIDCAEELAAVASLTNLTNNELGAANGKFNNDFENNQTAILDNTFTLSDNRTLPTELERDLLLAYGFRNLGGHNVHSYSFVYERLPAIFQRVMNVLFLSCEELLP